MTREEIMAMSSGREFDALVAEKVMGWERRTLKRTNIGTGETDFVSRVEKKVEGPINAYVGEDKIPYYSTDISAAWEVVEKLKIKGLYMAFAMHSDTYNFSVWDSEGVELIADWVRCETAPEAICKAALISLIK